MLRGSGTPPLISAAVCACPALLEGCPNMKHEPPPAHNPCAAPPIPPTALLPARSLVQLLGHRTFAQLFQGSQSLFGACSSRVPVLAIGSNASPLQLRRKFGRHPAALGLGAFIPVRARPTPAVARGNEVLLWGRRAWPAP